MPSVSAKWLVFGGRIEEDVAHRRYSRYVPIRQPARETGGIVEHGFHGFNSGDVPCLEIGVERLSSGAMPAIVVAEELVHAVHVAGIPQCDGTESDSLIGRRVAAIGRDGELQRFAVIANLVRGC